jgi:LmbE family N-acetylglucosaminyl deacetylase
MKKIIFAIFAHPDDETFGPSGALLKAVKEGAELHLIALTDGAGGTNLDNLPNLGEIRLQEWQKAAKLLDASSTHYLGYRDGQLHNLAMIEIGKHLVDLITDTLKTAPSDAEVEILTLDLNGYTGHIDHIVAARAASFAFYKLKETDTRLQRILYACLPEHLYPAANTNWLFMEKGRSKDEINETIDAREYRNELIELTKAHDTQRQDAAEFLKTNGDELGLNYFMVRE